MGYSHQASFFHTIGFEKASERMGPGYLNHQSTKKPAPSGAGLMHSIHYMAARPINSYLFISSIMASAP